MTSLHRVDDTDPQVVYSGPDDWITGGEPQEFSQTTHGTYTGGSQVRFTFSGAPIRMNQRRLRNRQYDSGLSVAVYGTISNERGGAPIEAASISTYSIDGSGNATFAPSIPSAVQYQRLLYQSRILENTQHILVITSLVSDSAFWLDYFEVGTASAPLPSTSTVLTTAGALLTSMGTSPLSTTPSTNHPRPSSTEDPQLSAYFSASSGLRDTLVPNGGTSMGSYISPTIHPQPSTTQDGGEPSESSTLSNTKGARINKGLIAGVATGGVVVVVLVAIIIWATFKFRRKARRSSSLDAHSIQPFIYPNQDWTPSLSALERNPSGYLAPDRRLHFTTGGSTAKPLYGPERTLGGLGPEHANEPATQTIPRHSANLIPPHIVDSESVGPPPAYDDGP